MINSFLDDVFINDLPTLDLHGEMRITARILVNEFINDNYFLGNKKVIIIHGIGKGALKEETHKVLYKNKNVDSFHLNHYNSGCTLVYIKRRSE